MGAGNVKLAYAKWALLPDLPFRVFVFMALVTKDTDKPPRYWDRWEALALSLGRVVPDEANDDAVRLERQAALRAVNRATGALVRAKAVTIEQRSSPGRTTVYQLNLEAVDAYRPPLKSQPSMERRTPSVQNGGRQPSEHSTPSVRTVDANRPSPRKDEEEDRTEERNESRELETAVTGPRASDAATNPEQIISTKVNGKPIRPYGPTDRATQTIAEAQSRMAARRAAFAAAKSGTEDGRPS